jgi:predicted DNA-binding protein (MmcQ/YjbR family)
MPASRYSATCPPGTRAVAGWHTARVTSQQPEQGRGGTRVAETAAALRAFALGLPGAWEDSPWGEDDRTAKVGRKVFAFLGQTEPDEGYRISLKLPDSVEQALALACCEPTGYGLGRASWVTVAVGAPDCPPLEVLLDWVEESYRTIAPKSLVRELDASGREPGAPS